METFSDYIERKTAETQEQLKRQSAINADTAANAMASAAIAATNTHVEATSGGLIDSDIKAENITAARDMQAQQENIQPSTEGPVDRQPQPDYPADNNPRMIAIAKDVVGQEQQQEQVSESVEQPMPAIEKKEETPAADNAQADGNVEENQQIKLFSDRINEYAKYKQQQEDEMKAREKANTISTMATGATEVAAGIINMLSVGEGHASNQIYRNYSHDWMRKAEQDLREHRNRRENLQATMNRLKEQQQQVQNAARLEDIREKQRRAQEEAKAAEDEYNRKLREKKIEDDRDADMLLRGFVPDENAPGGYRFDPNLAAQIAGAKKGSSASGSKATSEGKTSSGGKASPGTKQDTGSNNTSNGQPSGGTVKKNITVPTEEEWNGEQRPEEKKTKTLADELRGN